mgnify:CR=1 FL=1
MSFTSFFSRMSPVTKNLVIINVLVWLFMAVVPSSKVSIDSFLALHYFTSPGFNIVQLVTYMFIHSGFTHMFLNMFALVMFGSVIENALGSKRFLVYYISCGIGAALIQEGVFGLMIAKYSSMFSPADYQDIISRGFEALKHNMNFTDPTAAKLNELVNTPMVGASGAVYGVLLAFGVLFPNQPIYLMFIPVPIKAKWMVVGYVVIELVCGVGGYASSVAHFAHLGGMLVGFLLIMYWKKRGDLNNHWFF